MSKFNQKIGFYFVIIKLAENWIQSRAYFWFTIKFWFRKNLKVAVFQEQFVFEHRNHARRELPRY